MAFLQGSFFSNSLEMNVNLSVVIPQDIKEGEEIKTLFLFHGYQGFHLDWIRHSMVERHANLKRVAIVMPAVQNSYYANMKYGLNFFDFISIDIPEIIESTFNLKLTKNNTYVAGLSMGGYGALKLALTYPEKFKGVASLSGALDIKEMFNHMKNERQQKMLKAAFGTKDELKDENDLFYLAKENDIKDLDIYIACGKDDFLYGDNIKFHNYLNNLKIDHKFIENEGDHNWDYWNENIIEVLNYFFK